MPIYAYKCATCGHALDVLQKMADAPLALCPSCGAATFSKQVTAAGFQLKGSGWYVTDFRDGGKKKESVTTDKKADTPAAGGTESKSETKAETKADGASGTSTSEPASSAKSDGATESKAVTKSPSPPPSGG